MLIRQRPFSLPNPLGTGSLVAASLAVSLTGCANAPGSVGKLAVKPAYNIAHGGQVDLSYGYIARAREMEMDDQLAQAALWWSRAISVSPQRADAHQGLGLCLARQGRLQEGIASLRTAASLAPQNARILNNLGHALKLNGQREEAQAMFEAALKADPNHAQARYNLAMLQQPGWSMALAPTDNTAPSRPPVVVALAATPAPTSGPAIRVQQQPNVAALTQVAATSSVESVPLRTDMNLRVAVLQPVVTVPVAVAATVAPPTDTPPVVTLSSVTVEVFNGNGVSGAAKGLRSALLKQGVQAKRVANMSKYDTHTTRLVYKPGQSLAARQLAKLLPVSSELVEANAEQQKGMRADVRVVLGQNLSTLAARCLARAECVGGSAQAELAQLALASKKM